MGQLRSAILEIARLLVFVTLTLDLTLYSWSDCVRVRLVLEHLCLRRRLQSVVSNGPCVLPSVFPSVPNVSVMITCEKLCLGLNKVKVEES